MPDDAMPAPADADRPPGNALAELQARQAALIKKGQELMRELDKVTAEIAQHQSNRDDAAARWNKPAAKGTKGRGG